VERVRHSEAINLDGRPELRLGPDGKLMLVGFTASVQQAVGGNEIELNRAVRQCVTEELANSLAAIPGLCTELPTSFHVNGAGNFEVGGPEGDNGLSGKKLVVDAYGRRVPIGGGALSGKDFFKADRAGAISADRRAHPRPYSSGKIETLESTRDTPICSLRRTDAELPAAVQTDYSSSFLMPR
jgi:hypothetical protein